MLETTRTVGAGDYSFQKVFSEGEFLASGVLELPKGAKKPNKNSHSSAMVIRINSDIRSVARHCRSSGTQDYVHAWSRRSILCA
jgi:threonine synthase